MEFLRYEISRYLSYKPHEVDTTHGDEFKTLLPVARCYLSMPMSASSEASKVHVFHTWRVRSRGYATVCQTARNFPSKFNRS